MWYFERFDLCKSSVTYQNNYTETQREREYVSAKLLILWGSKQTSLAVYHYKQKCPEKRLLGSRSKRMLKYPMNVCLDDVF